MNDIVVDSNVVAKWLVTEPDSPKADRLMLRTMAAGGRMFVVDLVYPEVANVIWKKSRQGMIAETEARESLRRLSLLPVRAEPATRYLSDALDIAIKYDRAVYDALFVALVQQKGITGVTADQPLYHAVHGDFPQVVLLRDL